MTKPKASRKKKSTAASNVDPILKQMFEGGLSKGELKKIEIVKSAIQIIGELGIEATSFESIGKPLGIRKAHVAYHFKNKTDIIEAAIRYIIAKGQEITIERVTQAQGTKDRLAAMARATFEWTRSDPRQIAVYMLFGHYGTVDPKYQSLHTEIRQTGLNRISALLSQDPSITQRLAAPEVMELATSIQAVITGEVVGLYTSTASQSPTLVDAAEARCVRAIHCLAGYL